MTATRFPSWLTPPPVDVALEITSRRVTVAQVTGLGPDAAVSACGSESLPPEAITQRSSDRTSFSERRCSMRVAPHSNARGSKRRRVSRWWCRMLRRACRLSRSSTCRRKSDDLDQLIRFHVKKTTPFPVEEAQVSHARSVR